jgi:poly(A) polymerase
MRLPMLPARQITLPDWMKDDRTMKLIGILGAYEAHPQALFVGGCVRNAVLESGPTDIDIATIHYPLAVMERLENAGIRYITTGLDHGTVTAIIEGIPFEITTLRKDVETDGRRAVIAFTDKWEEDAQRRDFTINTLLASPEGIIFDPTGQGLADLDARSIKFVGDPTQRIAEDYLRILRFFRFYAQYGHGELDGAALQACAAQADNIAKLSKERITQEFLKILGTQNAAAILSLMFSSGVLVDMGKNFAPDMMEKFCGMQTRHEAVHVIARLFCLAGMKAEFFEERLILSNAQKKMMETLEEGFASLKSIHLKNTRALVYKTGNDAALQIYLLKLAETNAPVDLELVDMARYWQAPKFPVTGEDLRAAGVPPGPQMGQKLKSLEEKWIASDFQKVPKILD